MSLRLPEDLSFQAQIPESQAGLCGGGDGQDWSRRLVPPLSPGPEHRPYCVQRRFPRTCQETRI